MPEGREDGFWSKRRHELLHDAEPRFARLLCIGFGAFCIAAWSTSAAVEASGAFPSGPAGAQTPLMGLGFAFVGAAGFASAGWSRGALRITGMCFWFSAFVVALAGV